MSYSPNTSVPPGQPTRQPGAFSSAGDTASRPSSICRPPIQTEDTAAATATIALSLVTSPGRGTARGDGTAATEANLARAADAPFSIRARLTGSQHRNTQTCITERRPRLLSVGRVGRGDGGGPALDRHGSSGAVMVRPPQGSEWKGEGSCLTGGGNATQGSGSPRGEGRRLGAEVDLRGAGVQSGGSTSHGGETFWGTA